MASPRLDRRTLPDQAGRTVVVTGANSGIGLETALVLARHGAHVVMACRDEVRGAAARDQVVAATGSDRVELRPLDLASLASIHAFADGLLTDHPRIDVLVNNAGLVLDERRQTEDGFELMVGVNHLGHHLLAQRLRERIVASAPSRIVAVSSVAHHRVLRPLDAAALAGLDEHGDPDPGFNPFLQYARSKLANLLFARELARQLAGTGVTVAAAHPGVVRSGFGAEGDHAVIGPLVQAFGRVVMISPRRGARTQIALAARPPAEVEPFHGAYVVRGRAHRPSKLGRDDAHAAWLWAESERALAAAG